MITGGIAQSQAILGLRTKHRLKTGETAGFSPLAVEEGLERPTMTRIGGQCDRLRTSRFVLPHLRLHCTGPGVADLPPASCSRAQEIKRQCPGSANMASSMAIPRSKQNYFAPVTLPSILVSYFNANPSICESAKSTSIIRGFSPSRISSSSRSLANLNLTNAADRPTLSLPESNLDVFAFGGSFTKVDGHKSSFEERAAVRLPKGDATEGGLPRPD